MASKNGLWTLKQELKNTYGEDQEKERRLDFLRYQYNEIEQANLKENEEEELEEKHKMMQNAEKIKDNEGLILILAKRGMTSYFPKMRYIPDFLNKKLPNKNYLLIYPYSKTDNDNTEIRSVRNHDDFVEIGNIIKKIFR